jgi:hypothetical protein
MSIYYVKTRADNSGYTNHKVTCLVVMGFPFDSEQVAHPLIYSILFPQQSKVRLFIPFEMATILLFHSVDYL